MTATENGIYISTGVIMLFGGPFFLGLIDTLATDNQAAMPSLTIMGFAITVFCLAVLALGVWIDG